MVYDSYGLRFFEASMDTKAGSVICVLDALDESDQNGLQTFVDCLSEFWLFNPYAPRLKFILTTRGYPQILNKFNRLSHTTVSFDGEDDDEVGSRSRLEQEIDNVTQDRLDELFEQRRDIGEKSKRIIKTGLSQKGFKQATYLWMHLMFEILEKTYPRNPKDWGKLFEGPPGDIAQVYDKLLQHVSSGEKDAVRATLGLIIIATQPLTAGELVMALNARDNVDNLRSSDFYEDLPTPIEFVSWLHRGCGSFVSVFAGKVYLIHQTAREFLITAENGNTKNPSTSVWQGSIVETEAHRHMAESCAVSLSLDEMHALHFDQQVQRRRSVPNSYDDHLSLWAMFTDYAADNLIVHFLMCRHQLEGHTSDRMADIGEEYTEIFSALFHREESELLRHILAGHSQLEHFQTLLSYIGVDCYGSPESVPNVYRVMCAACRQDSVHLLKCALEIWEKDEKRKDYSKSILGEDSLFLLLLPHFAARGNATLCLHYLHSRGFDMGVQGPDDETSLHVAAEAGFLEAMSVLIGFDVSTTTLDNRKRTALVLAMATNAGTWDLVEEFLASRHDREEQFLTVFSIHV
ncbi:ankyrin repeat protein [Colletotrichum sojae]|uniref:Ankyrin repeat protein n=1 Tax=Colletotrichum sojae TaxID=2175907 RepID=A0A8H6J210_9PEZI|nr:ankyrin repeat protein [Colletotrichum sojae]